MAMRDEIRKRIEEGGATKEILLELTGTTDKGLASQFTYLRMLGTCPMKQEDGTFKIVSTEEWEAKKAAGGGSAAANLTPEQRVDKAIKREKRAAVAHDNAQKKLESDPDDRLTQLKAVKAECELEISGIELGKAEAHLAEVGPTPVEEDPIADNPVNEDAVVDLGDDNYEDELE